MTRLQQYLIIKDKEMKKTTSRVTKAMRETVDIDGLADKVFTKYFKFIQTKATTQGSHLEIKINKKGRADTRAKANNAAPNDKESMQTPTDLGLVG